MNCVDVVNAVSSVLLACAAILGALVAWLGLKTWKRELRGRTEYDLSQRILRCVLEVRNAIALIRGDFTPTAVSVERWNRLNEQATRLDGLLLEAEIIWDDKLQEPKRLLHDCLVQLRSAKRCNERIQKEPTGCDEAQKAASLRREETERILFQTGEDGREDRFGTQLGDAVASFSKMLKPYLRSR